ncbi:hypothetical protein ANO11243_084730 [Dothideomycetidae sp. 11243]|nr:hypothetical protein ANO11243_084730 [fungal sp. No.11243]
MTLFTAGGATVPTTTSMPTTTSLIVSSSSSTTTTSTISSMTKTTTTSMTTSPIISSITYPCNFTGNATTTIAGWNSERGLSITGTFSSIFSGSSVTVNQVDTLKATTYPASLALDAVLDSCASLAIYVEGSGAYDGDFMLAYNASGPSWLCVVYEEDQDTFGSDCYAGSGVDDLKCVFGFEDTS